jgi:hypothetical protein
MARLGTREQAPTPLTGRCPWSGRNMARLGGESKWAGFSCSTRWTTGRNVARLRRREQGTARSTGCWRCARRNVARLGTREQADYAAEYNRNFFMLQYGSAFGGEGKPGASPPTPGGWSGRSVARFRRREQGRRRTRAIASSMAPQCGSPCEARASAMVTAGMTAPVLPQYGSPWKARASRP